MYAAVLSVELHLPIADSLKAKRATITPILEGSRRRFKVSAAEVGDQDSLRHSELAFAAVGSAESVVRETLDAVERFVWSFPEIDVTDHWRNWLDNEEQR